MSYDPIERASRSIEIARRRVNDGPIPDHEYDALVELISAVEWLRLAVLQGSRSTKSSTLGGTK